MNRLIIYILTIACWLASGASVAQTTVLSLENAIAQTLENNYAIRIADNNIEVATNNTSKEALGYNPTVDAQAGISTDLSNNISNFSSGETITTGYAFAYGANASVTAAYDIINPSRDINLAQLNEVLEATELQKRITIENNIATVMSTYYEIGRQLKNVELQKETISLSQQRLSRAKVGYQYGQSNRLDILNAEVDISRDSITLVNLQQTVATTKRNLSNLIGIDLEVAYDVDTLLSFDPTLDLEYLIKAGVDRNTQVLLSDKNIAVSNYDYDLINATKKPSLSANADYSFNYSKSAPGSFFSSSRSDGLGLGATLRYNIYDGGLRKVQQQNTKLSIEGQLLQKDELIRNIKNDITNAWYDYQNALFIINAEESSLRTNEVNFERTSELYKVGQTGSVEFRQAQLNLFNALNSYINAQYDAKQIEIQLLLLSGELID